MGFFAHDIIGYAVATVLAPLFLLPVGALLLAAIERTGIDCGQGWERAGWAFLLGLAITPAIDGLLIRYAGLAGTVAAHGVLLVLGLPFVVRLGWRVPGRFVLALLLWWVVVANAYVDYDWGPRLYQSVTVLDLVKHSAVIETIIRAGIPLQDPFFLRDKPAGYYFYYYSWPAQLRWLAAPIVDSRMAFAGVTFWTGPGVPALLYRVAQSANLLSEGQKRRYFAIAIALCFVTGADLPFMLAHSFGQQALEAQVDWWNETVSFALASMLWVPQHLLSLIAAWMAFLLVQEASSAQPAWRWFPPALAGAALATVFGASVWIALTVVPIVAVWAVVALRRGELRKTIVPLCVAGVVALILAFPQLLDVLHGRDDPTLPVSLTVRRFLGMSVEASPWQAVPLLLLLPGNLAIEFGVFALGTIAYFRKRPRDTSPGERFLILTAVVSLIVACFLRSNIINNDLGWRAIWFAEIAAMVWTAWAIQTMPQSLKQNGRFKLLLALGIAGVVWDIVGMRLISPPIMPQLNLAPKTTFSERRAYEWADSHLPASSVIQQNPAHYERVFSFGLYGQQRTAVADIEANLFGASLKAVTSRVEALAPIFDVGTHLNDIRRIAAQAHIDAILWTDQDQVWKWLGGPPPGATCDYRDSHVCMMVVRNIPT